MLGNGYVIDAHNSGRVGKTFTTSTFL